VHLNSARARDRTRNNSEADGLCQKTLLTSRIVIIIIIIILFFVLSRPGTALVKSVPGPISACGTNFIARIDDRISFKVFMNNKFTRVYQKQTKKRFVQYRLIECIYVRRIKTARAAQHFTAVTAPSIEFSRE